MAKLRKGETPFDEVEHFQDNRFQMGGWGQLLSLGPIRRKKPSKLLLRLFKKMALVMLSIIVILAGIIFKAIPIAILLTAAIWAIYWRYKSKSAPV
jgi:hypothetical protein